MDVKQLLSLTQSLMLVVLGELPDDEMAFFCKWYLEALGGDDPTFFDQDGKRWVVTPETLDVVRKESQ